MTPPRPSPGCRWIPPIPAFISCGTWGLVGVETLHPVLTAESRQANFTNEAGVDGRVRFLRNVMGLWLLSESVRAWESAGARIDLAALLDAAAGVDAPVAVFDPNDPAFLPPGDMPSRIATYCEASRPGRTPQPRRVHAQHSREPGECVRRVGTAGRRTLGMRRHHRACGRRRRTERVALPTHCRSRRHDGGRGTCRGDGTRQPGRASASCGRDRRRSRVVAWVDRPALRDPAILAARCNAMTRRQLPRPSAFGPAQVQATRAELDQAPTRRRPHDLRPASDRQAAHSPSSVRLHRRGRRGRAVAGHGSSGVRGHRVPPRDSARRGRLSTSWDVLGAPVAYPFGIAPTGFTRMMHTEGERRRSAAAAGAAGIPFSLSTVGTTSPSKT